jgi:hypothetical protein
MSEAMQERLHRWNAPGVETKKQVRSMIAAMAFQNIGLEIGEHRRLIGIGSLPRQRRAKAYRHFVSSFDY